MTAATFDTLKFARALRDKANLAPDQAEGFAAALADAFQDEVATKRDLGETELRLEAKIEAVKSDLFRWVSGAIGF